MQTDLIEIQNIPARYARNKSLSGFRKALISFSNARAKQTQNPRRRDVSVRLNASGYNSYEIYRSVFSSIIRGISRWSGRNKPAIVN
jgi:hypothetical protein